MTHFFIFSFLFIDYFVFFVRLISEVHERLL